MWLSYKNYLKFNQTVDGLQTGAEKKRIVHAKPLGVLSAAKSRRKSAGINIGENGNLPMEPLVDGHPGQEDIIQPVRFPRVKSVGLNDQREINMDVKDLNVPIVKELKLEDENNAAQINRGRRRLLNFNEVNMNIEELNMNIHEDTVNMNMNEDSLDNTSFISSVDIQPDSVKLLPWETGSLAELQKVFQILFF